MLANGPADGPAVAYSARDHRYLVSWESNDRMRMALDDMGQPAAAPVDFAPAKNGDTSDIAANGKDGGFLIVWHDGQPRSGGVFAYTVYAQPVAADGSGTHPPVAIAHSEPQNGYDGVSDVMHWGLANSPLADDFLLIQSDTQADGTTSYTSRVLATDGTPTGAGYQLAGGKISFNGGSEPNEEFRNPIFDVRSAGFLVGGLLHNAGTAPYVAEAEGLPLDQAGAPAGNRELLWDGRSTLAWGPSPPQLGPTHEALPGCLASDATVCHHGRDCG
jgi:hypothetical protein